ncbi:MAG: FKBP-type peptidyl-prolyl cis-trans isomerase [Ferruginibacter sp.]
MLLVTQIAKDSKAIEEYLAKNNIKATKTGKGTYVEIIEPGTGNVIDTPQVALVNYTGKTFDGVKFDSNTDSTIAQRLEPYPIDMLHPQVIAGWIEGLKMLRKGAKARFYVPSALAYGKRGNGEKIKPNQKYNV